MGDLGGSRPVRPRPDRRRRGVRGPLPAQHGRALAGLRRPGVRAKCAVQVLDKSYSIVGWKEITLAPSEQRTRSVSTEVTTTTRGVTGLIHDCWIP
ncbi:DUF4307 domain-containing protein [Curtobacterium sp. 24E2]|nr:DUF4307 domain-containing protein [Curtobacterium sp. 24E2]